MRRSDVVKEIQWRRYEEALGVKENVALNNEMEQHVKERQVKEQQHGREKPRRCEVVVP